MRSRAFHRLLLADAGLGHFYIETQETLARMAVRGCGSEVYSGDIHIQTGKGAGKGLNGKLKCYLSSRPSSLFCLQRYPWILKRVLSP